MKKAQRTVAEKRAKEKELLARMIEHEKLPQVRRESAYHEAGHAAMLFMFGEADHLVSINMRAQKAYVANTRSRTAFWMIPQFMGSIAEVDEELRAAKTIQAAKAILFCLTGPAAGNKVGEKDVNWFQLLLDEFCWSDSLLDPPERNDTTAAVQMAATAYGEKSKRCWRFLWRMADWTDELLAEPRVWAVVEALAEHLQRVDYTRGRKAEAIMRAAWGDDGYPIPALSRKWRRRFGFVRERLPKSARLDPGRRERLAAKKNTNALKE